jgi:hypothetical protein
MNEEKIPYSSSGIISYTWYSEKHPLFSGKEVFCLPVAVFNKLQNHYYKDEYVAKYKKEEVAMKAYLNAKKELHG